MSLENVIKLASNENPYGCSPKVIKGLRAIISRQVPLYPDDSFCKLKSSLANHFMVQDDNIVIGCGSDQVISFCIRIKSHLKGQNTKLLCAGLTFPMYKISADMEGVQTITTSSKAHNIEEFYHAYKTYKPDIIFLCIPNNPLGECLDAALVIDFIASCDNDTLIIIDGAYQEYALYKNKSKHISPKYVIDRFANVVYLGTFSKAYGLGGMRVGYGIASEFLIKALHKLRPPFNITSLSLQAAILALNDQGFVRQSVASNFDQMKVYEDFFKKHNINYVDSFANFITVILPENMNSTNIEKVLLNQGIIIRNFPSFNALRITIGTEEENKEVLERLKAVLNSINV